MLDHDVNMVKSCIARISKLNDKQTNRAMKETARNRKVNSIGSFDNMTIGQAYYNLNKNSIYNRSLMSGGPFK